MVFPTRPCTSDTWFPVRRRRAGGMFYLTVTDLVPEAEERQYQQMAAVAMGEGFVIVFILSSLIKAP